MDRRGRPQPLLCHVIAQLDPRMHESFRWERFYPCLSQPILRVWQEKRSKRKVNASKPELPAGNSPIAPIHSSAYEARGVRKAKLQASPLSRTLERRHCSRWPPAGPICAGTALRLRQLDPKPRPAVRPAAEKSFGSRRAAAHRRLTIRLIDWGARTRSSTVSQRSMARKTALSKCRRAQAIPSGP